MLERRGVTLRRGSALLSVVCESGGIVAGCWDGFPKARRGVRIRSRTSSSTGGGMKIQFLFSAMVGLTFGLMASSCTSTPGARSLAPAPIPAGRVEALVRRAAQNDSTALVIWKEGELVLERWFDGEPRPIESMSITKSVTALAIGRLVTDGRLDSIDRPLSDWYPQWREGPKSGITLRHLLAHTSGLDPWFDRLRAEDPVAAVLDSPLVSSPGTRFEYNNAAIILLPAVVHRISGKPMDELVRDEIFAPLGIRDFSWARAPNGIPYANAGLQIRPADLARIGELLRNRGTWRGHEILSSAWIDEMLRPGTVEPTYGLLWWMEPTGELTFDTSTIPSGDPLRGILDPYSARPLRFPDLYDTVAAALEPMGGLSLLDGSAHGGVLKWRRIEDVAPIGFRANGWGGQNLIVLPDSGLIVVRMREIRPGDTPEVIERYGFNDELGWAVAHLLD